MKTKLIFLSIIFFICISRLAAQHDSVRLINERLLLDLPIWDFSYLKDASIAAYNKYNSLPSDGPVQPSFGDYIRSYENPSMQQALAITKDLHSTNYYFQNKIWNKLLRPDTRKKRIVNRIVANATAGAVDYALAYQGMVFSPVWLHEEFHRNGLSLAGIGSFDDTYYKLGGDGEAGGSVSKVLDQDLIRFKQLAPIEMVRSFSSGIESQYELIRNLQKDNFFHKTQYPNVVMNILLTQAAVSYVNQFKRSDYDSTIDSMNARGNRIADRDFVGWDMTAWVYDMFRPEEPYTGRGVHPNGNGVNRIIKRSSLTSEEDDYLTKMGQLQYLNFISPSMIGINRIKIGDNTGFNFAMRHYLTSFGNDINLDLFVDHHSKMWLVGLHAYQNKEKLYPGLELQRQELIIPIGNRELVTNLKGMLWMQPEDESFYAVDGKAGGLFQFRTHYNLSRYLSIYLECEAKTDGWVAGNPYLQSNANFRTGLYFDINK
ncbi:MAG: hypothetical protein IPL46_09790 [Saprospiraceae bacterium]|nr:hypothetical protein [Saprospiraceae bacterium]